MQTVTRTFSIHVKPATQPLTLSPDGGALPDVEVGQPAADTITISGGIPPYALHIGNGQLPPGLSIDANATITGTPTTEGDFSFDLTVTDSAP